MRINVSKYLFLGAYSNKEAFLKRAQEVGCVEFIHPKNKKLAQVPVEAERFALAIKCLREYTILEQEKKHNLQLAEEICHQVLELKQRKDANVQALDSLQHEISRIRPFGNFSQNLARDILIATGRTVRFYCAKTSKALHTHAPSLILINSTDGIDYFITVEVESLTRPDLIEMQITQELSSLYIRAEELKHIIHACDERLKSLTRYNWLLHYAFYKKIDYAGLDFATSATEEALEEKLFSIQGWIPNSKKNELFQVCESSNVFIEEVQTEPHEQPPTYLENKNMARVGEDLVHIFDTPSPTDKDPSLWLLTCFSLFFAMIVGDAGYGLIFLLTAFILHFKIKTKKDFTKRFLKLATVLSISCILWGVLTNSFFGISLSESNPIKKYSLIHWLIEKKAAYHFEQKDTTYKEWVAKFPKLKEATSAKEFLYGLPGSATQENEQMASKFGDNLTMELALFVGSIHLILGMVRYLGRNLVGAGWIAFIIGAYLYIPYYLGATSLVTFAFGIDHVQGAEFGLHLLFGGIVFAVIVAIIKQGILGIFEVMTSIQIFSDVLSYLRIYALGLAGAIMSSTINDLAAGLPLFIAIIMMIFAHGINIILSIMGGVIHGLRLNFLEWYHYSFEGGGKRFKPLAIHPFE